MAPAGQLSSFIRTERRGGGLRALAVCIAGFSSAAGWAQTPQFLISVTPCRVVDTRNPAGTFGGPSISGGTSRTLPITSGACSIPATATAFVLNITAVPQGPLIFLTVWPTGQPQPNASTLNAPAGLFIANGAIIPAGTNGSVDIFASNTTDVLIDVSGYFVPNTNSVNGAANGTSTALGTGASDVGTDTTALGFNVLQVNAGNENTGIGANALAANSLGNNNVALGASALLSNAGGSANTAVGGQALLNNFASDNTAVGFSALWTNTVGLDNTALGVSALYTNVSGSYNVALGQSALYSMTTGANNVALGYQAGYNLTTGYYNIDIGNKGQSADANAIRIGTQGTQTSAYVAGIFGTTVTGSTVLVNSNGQLGVATSSERFKEQIHDMGGASDGLMLLRPVTFRYKQPLADGAKPLQYGLVAEEVASVYPQLVVYDRNGQPESLQYHELPALLLNELQKQHRVITEQQSEIARQRQELKALQARMAALEAGKER